MENNEQNQEDKLEITEVMVEETADGEEIATVRESVIDTAPKKSFRININIKYVVIGLVVLAVLALIYYFRGLVVAATVNGVPIGRLEVISELERTGGLGLLDSLIRERLVNMEAAKQNITISREEIDAEFVKIEDSLKEQGTTLEEALDEQKLTRKDLEKKIMTQKKLERMLGDKIAVTDEDVEKYIKDSGVTFNEDANIEESKAAIKENIKNQKFGVEANTFVEDLVSKAKINYFVKY